MRSYLLAFLTSLSLLIASTSLGGDYAKGQEAYNCGDYENALAEWLPLAEAGDADGQFGVALLYANGFGVPLDDAAALKWYLLAADQGHGEAQCNLGVMYANGWGVPQSDAEALKWYGLAAEQGVTEAQKNLGEMYGTGFGVEQDKVEAHKWLAIATELGDNGAKDKLEEVARHMTADEVASANGLASTWLENHPALQANE